MKHEQPALPYSQDALAPTLSAETLQYHYGKHHAGYFRKLNAALENASSKYGDMTLEELVRNADAGDTAIFNNAAQAWNHTFYWNSMTPSPAAPGAGDLSAAIERDFGSMDALKERFIDTAKGQFGSGWAWLALDKGGKLMVCSTGNAGNPLRKGAIPLLVCDVWEHAYYIDYRNERGTYLNAFWYIANWSFAGARFEQANKALAA